MKVKFTEQDVERILKSSCIKNDICVADNFTSSVMARVRGDFALPASRSIKDTLFENIYLKFVLGTSLVAVASVVIAFGVVSQPTYIFEEYVVADYIMNVI